MQIHNPSTNLRCPTCRVGFEDEKLHKQHYKSDFHRYNLKRSMVNLPPATLEQFSTKRNQTRQNNESSFVCGQCRKSFASQQTLNQHAASKKHNIHMIREQKSSKKDSEFIAFSKTPKKFIKNSTQCLFCVQKAVFTTIEENIQHMKNAHSFFIAQEQFCKNKQALLQYLQEKIQVGMLCILCDNKGCKDFATGEAVKKHMLSKGHTFMNTEKGFEQYEDFYDFSSQFKEKLEEQKFFVAPAGISYEKVKVIVDDEKKAKQQKIRTPKVTTTKDQNQDEWEDEQDSEEGSDSQGQWEDDSDDQVIAETQYEGQEDGQEMKEVKQKRKVKAYQIMVPTLTSTDELLLPNGKMLGHRKYKHLYKQAIRYNNWFQNNNLKMLDSTAQQNALITRQRLVELVKKEKLMKNFCKRQDKKYLNTGMNNNMLMKFFRTSCSL